MPLKLLVVELGDNYCMTKKRLVSFLLSLCFFFSLFDVIKLDAKANGSVVIQYVATVKDQAADRKMLDLVNSFRKSSEAWHYDQNGQVVRDSNLSELTFDYALERTAYKRAKEIAVYMSHDRPNGESISEITAQTYVWENISCGPATIQEAMEDFKETNQNYLGQNHRRNMLARGAKSFAVAHIEVNDVHYWVQLFGSEVLRDEQYGTDDDLLKNNLIMGNVDVLPENLGEFYIDAPKKYKNIKGSETLISTFPCCLKNGAAPMAMLGYGVTLDDYRDNMKNTFTVEDESIAKVEGYYLKFIGAGKTNLVCTTTFNNKEYSAKVPIEVTATTPMIGIQFDPVSMKVGEKYQMNPAITPADEDDPVTVSYELYSGDDIISISETGLITALKAGKGYVLIKARDSHRTRSVTCGVTVYDKNGSDGKGKSVTTKRYPKKGETFSLFDSTYKVEKNGNLTYVKCAKNVKKAFIANSVTVNGKKFKVTKIGNGAFKNNKVLTTVSIPDSIKTIGKDAFSGCKKLKNITIYCNCTNIGNNAFKGIYKKAQIRISIKNTKKYNSMVKLLKKKGAKKAKFSQNFCNG